MGTNFDESLDRIKKATGARTQVDLANILGIRQSSISDAKKRNSTPAEWLLKLYRTFGLNPDWITDGIEPVYLKPGLSPGLEPGRAERLAGSGQSQAKCRFLPVSGTLEVEGGDGRSFETQGEMCVPEQFICSSLMVVHMDGNGMEPVIRKGAYIGIDRDQKRVLSGEIYAVHIPMEGLTFKRVYFDPATTRYILRSENTGHPESWIEVKDWEAHVIGRVIWVMQAI